MYKNFDQKTIALFLQKNISHQTRILKIQPNTVYRDVVNHTYTQENTRQVL